MLLLEGIYEARITVTTDHKIDYEILSGPYKGQHTLSQGAMDAPQLIPGVHVGRIAIRIHEEANDGR